MLAFTLRMIITDIQKSFRGFWAIFYVSFLLFIAISGFLDIEIYSFIYVIIISFSSLIPNITKIFYVLPLGSKILRRYLLLRSMVLSLLFIAVGGIMSILSIRWPLPSIEKGWLRIMAYVTICILLSLTNIGASAKTNNKRNTIILLFITILIVGNFISAIFLINFKIQMLISILAIVVCEALLIVGLKKVNLTDYVEPAFYGIYTKSWRDYQKKQVAEAERRKTGNNTV